MKRKKRSPQKKEHKGAHHIIPSSRGGGDERANLYRWQDNHFQKHIAWHALFLNDMPEEVIGKIAAWKRKDNKLNRRFFQTRKGVVATGKLYYWETLFNGMTPGEAIEWIRREFIRKEWLRDN